MSQEDQPTERYFYHNFPRRRADRGDNGETGLKILDSICRNGLLLVPEKVSWTDPTQADPKNRTHALQRRISFTELAPKEVSAHAKIFGAFALEFPIEALRSLGAVPVIYIPDRVSADHPYDAAGVSVLSNLAAATAVIASLARTASLTGPTLEVKLTMKTGEKFLHEFDPAESAAIKSYLEYLTRAQGLPYSEMHGALTAMASLFYPTDDLHRTGPLGYYRHREWRLFSGAFVSGRPTTAVTTPQQRDELLSLDREFFSRELEFADGMHSLAAKSHFLSDANGRHVLTYASRVIVPSKHCDEARAILVKFGFETPVTAIE